MNMVDWTQATFGDVDDLIYMDASWNVSER